MEKKITKKEYFEAIKAILAGEVTDIEGADIAEFCDKEIASLDKRSTRAKERAEAKKAAADELAEEVFALLTNDYQTIADIAAQIEDQDISVSKVQYRLTKLVEVGRAEKAKVEVPATETSKKRDLCAYRLAQ